MNTEIKCVACYYRSNLLFKLVVGCLVVLCGNRNFGSVSVFKKRTEPNFICETVFYGYRGVVKNRQLQQ